jgi:hypothetical protein
VHAFFMIMGGFHYFEGSDKAGAHYNAIHPLRYQDVIFMLKNGTISLPTGEEIKDRSKSDCLAKTIALLQTLWFVAQCIARGIEKLPMTEMEIVTLAYTAMNVGMFIAWWDKPLNVDRPIRVFHKPVTGGRAKSPHWVWKVLFVILGAQDDWVNLHKRTKVPIFYSGKPAGNELLTADVITLAAGVVFGAIHCIAWSFDPSHTELLLWRLSSIAITAVPALLVLSLILWYLLLTECSPVFRPLHALLGTIIRSVPLSGLLYVAARLTTIVLAFINLSSLPPGAFQAVHWTTLILHL